MGRAAAAIGAAGLALAVAGMGAPPAVSAQPPRRAVAPKGPLRTLTDVRRAIRGCWQWPPLREVRGGMEMTVLLSFKRDGAIFGGRITYETPDVSRHERTAYYRSLARAVTLCSPLPVSRSLGEAIAGRPFYFHFRDTRKQRKASLDG